jgi:thiamine kinase-like enzyme
MFQIDKTRLSDLLRENIGLQVNPVDLRLLGGSGLQHDHVVLGQTGWLARIPRGNNTPDSVAYMARQGDVYATAMHSLHTPELAAAVAPTDGLPRGALIVRYLEDARKADFARDHAAIARSLAAIHAVLPPPIVETAARPGASQWGFIEAMLLPSLESKRLEARTQVLLEAAVEQARADLDGMARFPALPQGFIVSDAHPGNFLIDRAGKAWMVDLEYSAVDCPLVDAAMAMCPLTRQFDPENNPSAPRGTEQKFLAAWLDRIGQDHPPAARQALAEAHPAMQRVVLAGSLGWLAFWKTEGHATMLDIPWPTIRNWDRLAAKYLEPEALGAMLQQNGFGAKAGLPRSGPQIAPRATPSR